MRRIRRSVKRALNKLGYQIVRANQPFVSFENFSNLAAGYEGLLNRARSLDLREDPLRRQLLARLQGTPPVEAYEIIEALARTRSLDGDVCEFGVAQGETSALIAHEIRDQNKTLHLFDSFKGLSKPTAEDVLKDDVNRLGSIEAYAGAMAWPKWSVMARLEAVSFPEARYRIHEGFIDTVLKTDTTLPTAVSFAYVDFDLYEPIRNALKFLDRVTRPGAIIIVDDYDYFSTGAKQAVDEFVAARGSNLGRYSMRVPGGRHGHFAIISREQDKEDP